MATLYKYLKGSCMKKGEKSDACTSRGSDVMDQRREWLPEGAGRAVTAWWAGSRAACPQPARGFQLRPGPERGALGRSSLAGAAREASTARTWLRCGGGHGGTFPCRRQSCPSTMLAQGARSAARSSRTALGGQAEPDLPVPFATPASQRVAKDQGIQPPNPS